MARLIPIAVCTPVEYQKIHQWAGAHDVRHGGPEDIYDAPSGGAINVWGRDGWEKPDGHIHCTYAYERPDGQHPSETIEALQADPTLLAVAADRQFGAGAEVSTAFLMLDTQATDWLFVMYEVGTHGGELGSYRATDPARWGWDKDWTAAMAQEHFAAMYAAALGKPLPDAQRLPLPHGGGPSSA